MKKAEKIQGFEEIKPGVGKLQLSIGRTNASFELNDNFEFESDVDKYNDDPDLYARWFRVLSECVTSSRFFDFTEKGVLEKAVPLFQKIPIYANHNKDVERYKGYVDQVEWDSKNNPPGINSLFVLDRQADNKVVRGVQIGALRSASVTIWFEYKKSHPELRYYYDHIGTEIDGEIVRFIITKITFAGEVSIVWAGEDRNAKAFSMDETDDKNTSDNINNNQQKQTGGNIMFTEKLLKMFNLSADVNQEELDRAILNKLEEMKNTISSLETHATIGKNHVEAMRQQAETLYKAKKGEAVNESYIKTVIQKADLETAKAFVEEFTEEIEKTVPLKCPDCGATLSRKSSTSEDEDQDTESLNVGDYNTI